MGDKVPTLLSKPPCVFLHRENCGDKISPWFSPLADFILEPSTLEYSPVVPHPIISCHPHTVLERNHHCYTIADKETESSPLPTQGSIMVAASFLLLPAPLILGLEESRNHFHLARSGVSTVPNGASRGELEQEGTFFQTRVFLLEERSTSSLSDSPRSHYTPLTHKAAKGKESSQ